MDYVDQKVRMEIQCIVEKLQKLNCTLLGNKDDAWIMELLFKPGFHRYDLIEWMLLKLEYDTRKMLGPRNSAAEERMKNLQSTLSSLGIRQENNHDIIKGTAEVKEQLDFWCQLVDIIWLKYQIITESSAGESDEGIALSPEKNKRKYIAEEFEKMNFCICAVCASVDLNNLFKHDVQLIAPDVEREIKNLSPTKKSQILTVDELEEAVKANCVNRVDLHKSSFQIKYDDGNKNEVELNELEEELSNISIDFKNTAQKSFNDTYIDLKPLILQHNKVDDFIDAGPAFKNLEPLVEDLLQLNNSFPKLESSSSKISEINSNLDDLIDDPNYVNVLKLLKDEK